MYEPLVCTTKYIAFVGCNLPNLNNNQSLKITHSFTNFIKMLLELLRASFCW